MAKKHTIHTQTDYKYMNSEQNQALVDLQRYLEDNSPVNCRLYVYGNKESNSLMLRVETDSKHKFLFYDRSKYSWEKDKNGKRSGVKTLNPSKLAKFLSLKTPLYNLQHGLPVFKVFYVEDKDWKVIQ